MGIPAPTFDDFFNLGVAEAQTREPQLTFDEGDISEMYMVAGSAMADHLTGYAAQKFKILYLDGATGDDLTELADDRYGIIRNPAIQAFGVVTFTRSADTAGSGTIPAGTTMSTVADVQGNIIQFTTNTDTTFGPTTLTITGVAVTAVNAGSGTNIATNTLTQFNTSIFDPTITVTNPARMAGGTDEETDDALRQRVRNFPVTIRRGTLAALEYGALTVAGVGNAVASQDNTGLVTIYVSDSSGNSNATMVSNVTTELLNWVAAGADYSVIGASVFLQTIAVHITVRPGIDALALTASIQSAITARVNQLKTGENLFIYAIQQAVLNVDQNIISCVVSVPNGDVVPSANQLIRTNTSLVTLV